MRIKPATHDSGVRYDMQFVDGSGRVRLAITDAESTMSAALNVGVQGIGLTHFTAADVVRHPLVARIVKAYDDDRAARGTP